MQGRKENARGSKSGDMVMSVRAEPVNTARHQFTDAAAKAGHKKTYYKCSTLKETQLYQWIIRSIIR